MVEGRHAQTMWGRLARATALDPSAAKSSTAPDGDTLFLDHLDLPAKTRTRPPLLLLHGLEGSSNSRLRAGLLALAARGGPEGGVLNFRYCARDARTDRCIPNGRPRLYHSGETTDFDFVARDARGARRPAGPRRRGLPRGKRLLKWLGENPGDTTVAAAATLSVPYDLAAGDRYMAPSRRTSTCAPS